MCYAEERRDVLERQIGVRGWQSVPPAAWAREVTEAEARHLLTRAGSGGREVPQVPVVASWGGEVKT
jgi:hypothetical protein